MAKKAALRSKSRSPSPSEKVPTGRASDTPDAPATDAPALCPLHDGNGQPVGLLSFVTHTLLLGWSPRERRMPPS